jgi:transcription antitermination factor NusA-like protein
MSEFFVGQIVWTSIHENYKNVCHIKCKYRSHGTRAKITGKLFVCGNVLRVKEEGNYFCA